MTAVSNVRPVAWNCMRIWNTTGSNRKGIGASQTCICAGAAICYAKRAKRINRLWGQAAESKRYFNESESGRTTPSLCISVSKIGSKVNKI